MNIKQFVRRKRLCAKRNIHFNSPITHIGKNITVRVTKKGCVKIGKNFSCRDYILFNIGQGTLTIGDDVFLNDGVKLNCRKSITIGDRVIIGQNVLFYDHDHDISCGKETMRTAFIEQDILIGNDVWIGSNVIILRGSVIGNGCVIGAGTVVKGRIEPNTMIYPSRELVMKIVKEVEN